MNKKQQEFELAIDKEWRDVLQANYSLEYENGIQEGFRLAKILFNQLDLDALITSAVEEEREECAKIAEEYEDELRNNQTQDFFDDITESIAKAIRSKK